MGLQVLMGGVCGDECLELGNELVVTPRIEVKSDSAVQRLRPQCLKTLSFRNEPSCWFGVGVGPSPPQSEGFGE